MKAGDVEHRKDGDYKLSEYTVYSDNSAIGIWVKKEVEKK